MTERLPLSIVILTLNEGTRLPACLASVAACDDVVVIDSGSADQTQAIARAAGARVFTNPFTNFAQQRNFAHSTVEFRNPWVFHLDADEQMTPELLEECRQAAASTPSYDGYYAAPRMMFNNQWLPRCTDYPAWQARFVRAQGFTFIQCGHGQREAPGMRMGSLKSGYEHDITPASDAEWEAKHRRYAREEAEEIIRQSAPLGRLLKQTITRQGIERRRAIKQLSHTLPARPWLRFVYQYILRGGFLDGAEAFHYCRLLARYEGFTAGEVKKLRSLTDGKS
jgi:glycosyltransferase involved in cell wall biosynthesis